MSPWRVVVAWEILVAFALPAETADAAGVPQPNVLVLYADDLGYADLGLTGNARVATPHLDRLAAEGVRFANGYVTGCVCSPSRAGLLTGRYQQRFGFDTNAEGEERPGRAPRGLDLGERTFADRLKNAGYATGLVGKWHLGAADGYRPTQRGFDEFYGILPHGIGAGKNEVVPIFRGSERVAVPDDHTIAFGEEAAAFVRRHRDRPWFLYVAFTAVHAPHVSPQEYLAQFADLPPQQARYYAMISCLDDAIGGILDALRANGLDERTLVFFASDNGGPDSPAVSNAPFRGGKWSLWEGGIRSPLLVRWKGRIPAGRVLPQQVTQLDFLSTALAAAGVTIEPDWRLDGTNLLPLLEGNTDAEPHEALFWRFGVQYAVRQRDWKLVKPSIDSPPLLFNLGRDPGEETDLALEEPERLRQLQTLWDTWNAGNEAPRWTDARWNGLEEKSRRKRERKAVGN